MRDTNRRYTQIDNYKKIIMQSISNGKVSIKPGDVTMIPVVEFIKVVSAIVHQISLSKVLLSMKEKGKAKCIEKVMFEMIHTRAAG